MPPSLQGWGSDDEGPAGLDDQLTRDLHFGGGLFERKAGGGGGDGSDDEGGERPVKKSKKEVCCRGRMGGGWGARGWQA